MVLIDQPEDGYADTRGWVEAIVDEERARDLLAEFCMDEDGDLGYRPTGPASRVHLCVEDPEQDVEDQRWVPVKPEDERAVEFWEVVVA
jgi:hypothetical protein